MRFTYCSAPLVALLLLSSQAYADLDSEAAWLADAWRKAKFVVVRKKPIFLDAGRIRALPLEPANSADADCTTVALLGVRGSDFAVRVASFEEPFAPSHDRPSSSVARAQAGLVSFTRCGTNQAELAQAAVEMRTSRGTLEMIVARGPTPAPAPVHILTERAVSTPHPLPDPGRAPGQGTLQERVERVEQRAKLDGALSMQRDRVRASNEGTGRIFIRLKEGCHRLELLAQLGAQKRVADVDAELREASSDRVLARDRSDTPDVRLDVCAGEPIAAVLLFAGAPVGAEMMVLDAHWELPAGIPLMWGPRVRATMAKIMLLRKLPPIASSPIAETLGVNGSTACPLEVEPGSCYVASVATLRGEPRGMGLSVRAGSVTAQDDGGLTPEGALLSFCPQTTEHASLIVEARGAGVAWVLAAWRTGPTALHEMFP